MKQYKMPNKALLRTSHKVRRPENADVGTKWSDMKCSHRTYITIAITMLLGVLGRPASGFIYVGDAVLNGWMTYDLYLSQSIPLGEGAFFIQILTLGNDDFQFQYNSIAELYSLHEAYYGLEFTPAYVQGDSPPLMSNNNNPGSGIVNIPLNDSIYLGYWDDRSPIDSTPTANDSYGWIELQNTDSGLVLLDGATAAGSGILVGTYSQIPEPTAISLICMGAGALVLRSRRKKRDEFQQAGPAYPPQGVGSADP